MCLQVRVRVFTRHASFICGAQVEGLEYLMRSMCCVLGQSTLLSQCLSPLRCIKGFLGIFKEAWGNARGYSCNLLVSHPGRIRNTPSLFLRKPGKASAGWVTRLNYRFYLTIMWCMHNDLMKGWKRINTKI